MRVCQDEQAQRLIIMQALQNLNDRLDLGYKSTNDPKRNAMIAEKIAATIDARNILQRADIASVTSMMAIFNTRDYVLTRLSCAMRDNLRAARFYHARYLLLFLEDLAVSLFGGTSSL